MSDKKNPLSQTVNDAIITTALIDEMARADNWQSLDECLAFKPEVIETFAKYAEAALRVMKRMEKNGLPIAAVH